MGSLGTASRRRREGTNSAVAAQTQKSQGAHAVDVNSVRDRVIDRLKKAGLSTSRVEDGSGAKAGGGGRRRSASGATAAAPMSRRGSEGGESGLQGPTLTKIMQRRDSLSFCKEAMQVAQSIDGGSAKPATRFDEPLTQNVRILCSPYESDEQRSEMDDAEKGTLSWPHVERRCPPSTQTSSAEEWAPSTNRTHSSSSEQAVVQRASVWDVERGSHDAPSVTAHRSPASCYSRKSTSPQSREGGGFFRPNSEARVQAQIQAYSGQIAALQEELSALRELGEERQVAIERLSAEAQRREEQVAELQSKVHSLGRAASEAEQLRVLSRSLAEHNCRMLGEWKQLISEHGVDVSAVKELSVEEVLGQGREAMGAALQMQLTGLEQCRAVLRSARNDAAKSARERSKLTERMGAMSAELESCRVREKAALERVAQLEEQLRRARQCRQAEEEAIRRSAEEQVMQGQVAKLIQSHTSTVAALQAAASKAEASANRQAAAEAAASSLKQQLGEEQASRRRREEELLAEVRSTREQVQRKERSEGELQQRARQTALELRRLQDQLSEANTKRAEEAATFRAKLSAAEEEAAKRDSAANWALETERQRATEAREALNELLCEVEGLSTSLEAERCRAGSLSAALNTTREMVKTLKQQVGDKEAELTRLREEARKQTQLAIHDDVSRKDEESEREARRVAAELMQAQQVASRLSQRVEELEAELRQRRDDGEQTERSARQEVERLKKLVATLSSKSAGVEPQTSSCLVDQEEVEWLYAPPSPVRNLAASMMKHSREWEEHARGETGYVPMPSTAAATKKEADSVELFIPDSSTAQDFHNHSETIGRDADEASTLAPISHTQKEQELSALVDEVRRLQSRLAAKQQSLNS